MPVIINFKICDNSEDCSGIEVCPAKAFFWDDKKKTISVDNSKCISCGKCGKVCPVDAIKVARNQEEYARIKKEVESDPRKVSDLFIDRYGAQPIHHGFLIPVEKFHVQILRSAKPAVVELFNHDSIICLLRSIPIRDIFRDADIKYRKIEADPRFLGKYGVKRLPALLFFREGKLLGKIEGYYQEKDKERLIEKAKRILGG
jgi:Fe-S-cluster-containing hydrogenase component 2